MARESLKVDVRSEYFRWKAEQDPKVFISPPRSEEVDADYDDRKRRAMRLLDSIIDSRATRPSEVSWHALGGDAPRDELDQLIDKYAPDDDMDLPLWKLAQVLRDLISRDRPKVAEDAEC
jgi:hypothetical protein